MEGFPGQCNSCHSVSTPPNNDDDNLTSPSEVKWVRGQCVYQFLQIIIWVEWGEWYDFPIRGPANAKNTYK
jgi:hypothetical protein